MKDNSLFDSLATSKIDKSILKEQAYNVSNDLKNIAKIENPSEIKEIYRASDFAFMKDPFKFQNLDMKVNSEKSEGLLVCVVTVGGREMDFMINLSNTNGLNKGDILRIDLDKEGKESQTIWSEDFLQHVIEKSGDLSNKVDPKTILAGLEVNTYEDIIQEVSRGKGFQVDQKKAIDGINKNRGLGGKDVRDEKDENGTHTEEEEFDIEEAAAKAGVSVDAIQNFCDKNGIKKITGITFTKNVDDLSEKLGSHLQGQDGSEVIMIRAAGVNGKANSAYVIDSNGETLYKPGDTPNGEEFLLDVVKEGANGENIEDVSKAADETNRVKIGLADDGVSVKTSEIEGENMSDNLRNQLEQEIEQLMQKLNDEITTIQDNENISDLDKAKLIEERCISTHIQGQKLIESYGIKDVPGLTDTTLEKANSAVADTEKEELKQGAKDVLEVTGDVVTGVVRQLGVPLPGDGDPRSH